MHRTIEDASPCEGRDEMNLADFPIAALQRAQKGDGNGGKVDQITFRATRYDPALRQRVWQKVTITSTARDGLPTPADEHVILALLHAAKHGNDFTDATVSFAPSQLFRLMGWSPNGRSYARLRAVLRRLKALTIRYENAWWDAAGRGYQEEVATGIISAYRLARQTSGPRTPQTELSSSVTWTQQFHQSLQSGNVKRLDLRTFFSLSTPTAQRAYRFLDKRFYNTDTLSMDLIEFACGHVGLAEADNVAILKRRLAPALQELEAIGFIEKADAKQRYQKLKVGQWRINFRRVNANQSSRSACPPEEGEQPQESTNAKRQAAGFRTENRAASAGDAVGARGHAAGEPARMTLAREFYRLWDATSSVAPGPRDLEQAALLLEGRDADEAKAVVGCLVRVTRQQWPECRSLSGAVQKYLGDALNLLQTERRREADRQQARRQSHEQRQEQSAYEPLQARWEALSEEQRQQIEQRVRQRLGGAAPAAFVRRLCLQELNG